MALQDEIQAAAVAMVELGQRHRAAGKELPTRFEEAEAALLAAENVRKRFLGRLFGEDKVI